MKTNAELIELLERLKPGLENSSSSAEDAMIRVLPEVIAALAQAENFKVALMTIEDMHVPDQPAAVDVPEVEYVRRHHMNLRLYARAALKGGAA